MFFSRHGDRAILAARFVLGLRTWGSMLAGMSHMPFWRFQLFSAIGGLAWATIIGGAGYFLGSNLGLLETIVRAIGFGGLAIIVVAAELFTNAVEWAGYRLKLGSGATWYLPFIAPVQPAQKVHS